MQKNQFRHKKYTGDHFDPHYMCLYLYLMFQFILCPANICATVFQTIVICVPCITSAPGKLMNSASRKATSWSLLMIRKYTFSSSRMLLSALCVEKMDFISALFKDKHAGLMLLDLDHSC